MKTDRNKLIIAGADNFLTRSLALYFVEEHDYRVVILGLDHPSQYRHIDHVGGANAALAEWSAALENATAVIHFCSRLTESSGAILRRLDLAIADCRQAPALRIKVSSIMALGDTGEERYDESAIRRLHQESDERPRRPNTAAAPRTRHILLRTGLILHHEAATLDRLMNLTKYYLGGAAGQGNQYISWLHIHDFQRLIYWLIHQENAAGIYHATAPTPVTNAEFMEEMRKIMEPSWSISRPTWLVRLGAKISGSDARSVLLSQQILPGRLIEDGFEFQYSDIWEALADVLTY